LRQASRKIGCPAAIRLADKAAQDYVDARRAVLSIIEKQKSHTLGIADGSGRLVTFGEPIAPALN
jgi:hypothetical protein